MSTDSALWSRLTRKPASLFSEGLAAFAMGIAPRAAEGANEDTVKAERSLLEYSRQAWSIIRPGDRWVDGWAFGCICEHVQAAYSGQLKKLAIAVPPRHGKSLIVNVFGQTWRWTHDPQTRFIFSSYSDRLAKRDSMACRDILLSQWYRDRWGFRFAFKEDQNRQEQFNNDRGGFRVATTPGGMATGEGADVVVADDITSVEESFSPAALERAWRFWTQTMTLRFHDPEKITRVVCMQRTRSTDLIGRLISEGFGYEVLTLPFEAEPNRLYLLPAKNSEPGSEPGENSAEPKEGDAPAAKPKHAIEPTSLQLEWPELRDTRKDGEVLWPERFTNPTTVQELKRSVQAGQAGQLQQRPENDAGTVFKANRFKLFYPTWTAEGLGFILGDGDESRLVYASECLWFQTVDTALKADQANDEFAVCTAAKTPCGALLLYSVVGVRLLVPEQWPAMKQFLAGSPEWNAERREWAIPGRMRPWPKPLAIQFVEDKNSGTGLLQQARMDGYALHPLEADGNKVMRAATLATLYENGSVYHNAEGEWRAEYEEQTTAFPAAAHDDRTDAACYAAIVFVHNSIVSEYHGDVVYNESVHRELEARAKIGADEFIPPAHRPAKDTNAPPETIDDILAALRGAPKPTKPALDDFGRIRDEYLHHDD